MVWDFVYARRLLSNGTYRPIHDAVLGFEHCMAAKARRILDAPPRYLAQVKTDCLLTQRLPKRFTERLLALEALRHPDGTPVYRVEETKPLLGSSRAPRMEAERPKQRRWNGVDGPYKPLPGGQLPAAADAQVQHRGQRSLRVPAGPHVRQDCVASQQPSTKPRSGSTPSTGSTPSAGHRMGRGQRGRWPARCACSAPRTARLSPERPASPAPPGARRQPAAAQRALAVLRGQGFFSVEGVSQMVYILPERLLTLVRPAFDLVLRRIRRLKRCAQA